MHSEKSWLKSIFITHINEKSVDLSRFRKEFDRIYISSSRYKESVMIV